VNSSRILIFANESDVIQDLTNGLILRGYACTIVSSEEELINRESTDLLLIETRNGLVGADMTRRIKQERRILIVLLADIEELRDVQNDPNIDDFVLKPYNIDELTVRITRLLQKRNPREESAEYLKAGDVVIDLPRCEVWVRGKVVDLTFTEYELLKLLLSKKGQVFTRDVLLNRIWGYDYFGGDRTVDVHITRLRSKIEDPSHNFIETVRNIGYRIKANDK
jgi:DNA-binding response OmpR family regulator